MFVQESGLLTDKQLVEVCVYIQYNILLFLILS